MENLVLFKAIEKAITKKHDDYSAYKDLFDLCVNEEKNDKELAHEYCARLRQHISRELKTTEDVQEFYDLYKKTLLFDAPYSFDAYMLYLEINRKPNERFYQPRRKILKPLIDALQDLADGKLDELFLSMPPRVGKTSMILFFTTWLMGRDTEKTNLYSAFSAGITNMFYSGILEIIKDKVTYNYAKIFPYATIPDGGTNAQETTIDLGRKKKYHTTTCRSLYGTLNGSCDCNGILIADDLLSGIEEALSPDRLAKAWFLTDNNLIPRAKENAKILWVGTRWSINDPIGKRLDIIESNPNFANRRIEVINVPALNENDESNFQYDYGVGFSTEFYHQRRSSFEKNNDIASFMAQYMGQPIEREGTVFNPQDLRYFNGELPQGEPDCVYMALDPSWGGGDYVASPIGVRYDDDIYIVDVVFTNTDKTKSQPMVVQKLMKHNVTQLQIEANKTQASFGDEVNKMLKDKGYRCLLTRKAAGSDKAKWERIWESAPDIRENFIFLDSNYRDKDYNLFMQQVFSFKIEGKNKHDDAPDSLAMLSSMIYKSKRKVEVFARPF